MLRLSLETGIATTGSTTSAPPLWLKTASDIASEGVRAPRERPPRAARACMLGAQASFLVEFAEVEQILPAVAHIPATGLSLGRPHQPECGEA